MDIEAASRIYRLVRHLRFEPEPWTALKCLLALLAVVARAKPSAAFGFLSDNNEGDLRALRDTLVGIGLPTVITRPIYKSASRHLGGFPPKVVRAFQKSDSESYERRHDYLLWVGADPKMRSEIKAAVYDPLRVGAVLGYPDCCVLDENSRNERMNRAFATALVEKVGDDEARVLEALRRNLKVDIEFDPGDNLVRTDEEFPFVFHIACDTCLRESAAPSAHLNQEFEHLANTVDVSLQQTLIAMSKIAVEIGRIAHDSDARGLSPDTVDRPTVLNLEYLATRAEETYLQFVAKRPVHME
jgi:hypothetical protein